MKAIEINDWLDDAGAREQYPRLFHTFNMLIGLSYEDSAKAVSIAVGVCPHCWELVRGCQCWNDE